MEAFEDSNCHSLSDSFSLYERYMRSFSVIQQNPEENVHEEVDAGESSSSNSAFENIENDRDCVLAAGQCHVNKLRNDIITQDYLTSSRHSHILNKNFAVAAQSPRNLELGLNTLPDVSLSLDRSPGLENSSTDKSVHSDLPITSEDSKSNNSGTYPKPVVITSLISMENSNNAVDSVPMFRSVRSSETVFKLPITELSFNGAIKHVQKLKPMVDPITALSSEVVKGSNSDGEVQRDVMSAMSSSTEDLHYKSDSSDRLTDGTDDRSGNEYNRGIEDASESTGDSQYEEFYPKKDVFKLEEESRHTKYSLEQSSSSLEASFDSGVRSPDMFSEDGDDGEKEPVENFWDFVTDREAEEKIRVKKFEDILGRVPPPPSVTTLKTDVTEMLKNFYRYLPSFDVTTEPPCVNAEDNSHTPTKRVAFVTIPEGAQLAEPLQEVAVESEEKLNITAEPVTDDDKVSLEISDKGEEISKKSTGVKNIINTEQEIKEAKWPHVLKCKYHDVHYNTTKYSEKLELLSMKYCERFAGAETASSVTVFSGNLPSPSSASKRKALRMKQSQGKSPSARLSHLARRRQAFCSAATIHEKTLSTHSQMVLIDKKFFPHKKRTYTSNGKSPRKRTPGRKTPGKKTPGRKTPAKTPKNRSGGSSRKKAMRRLLMDPDTLSRSQPIRETTRRALFSPENRKIVRPIPCTSAPQEMKSKRVLFGPETAETKSLDGTPSDCFLKRKRDMVDGTPGSESRSKIPKSLSYGGDTFGSSQPTQSFTRRVSEVFGFKSSAELNELHKKKLLWAVSEALRVHGWRMGAPGFREKASLLARVTRKLLTLPPHAARLASPRISTSETMLKLARQYAFSVIQGRSIEECYLDEQTKLSNEGKGKLSGYISASTYQEMKAKQSASCTLTLSQIKENTCDTVTSKPDHPKSTSKSVLQDKLVNIDSNSNSNSGLGLMDKSALYKSNSMPSFNDAAKMRARRQISFDNIDLPKR